MKKHPLSFIKISILLAYVSGNPALSEPLSYQDCLLFATRQGLVDTPDKIKYVEQSCRERFPDSAPAYQQLAVKLSTEALSRIDIWTRNDDPQKLSASVYNGNSNIILTELVVLVSPLTDRGSMEDFFDSEEYEIRLKVEPYKTAFFELSPDSRLKGKLRWQILSAKGY